MRIGEDGELRLVLAWLGQVKPDRVDMVAVVMDFGGKLVVRM